MAKKWKISAVCVLDGRTETKIVDTAQERDQLVAFYLNSMKWIVTAMDEVKDDE